VRVTGEATVAAPPGRVRAALRDPAVLTRTIPGCQRLEVTGPGTCRLTLTAAVASTQGAYTGEAKLTSHDPESLTVTATLAGANGTIETTLHAKLTGINGGTSLGYEADAEVTGMVAAVGRRLLASAADRLASQFFDSLAAELAHQEPQSRPAGAVGEPEPGRPGAPAALTPAGGAGADAPAAVPASVAGPGAAASAAVPASVAGPDAPPAPAPAGRSVPGVLAPAGAAPAARSFGTGVLTGAALALAGVILARRRARR